MNLVFVVCLLGAWVCAVGANLSLRPLTSLVGSIGKSLQESLDGLKDRNRDYRSVVSQSFEVFLTSQRAFGASSKGTLERYMTTLDRLYDEIVQTRSKQQAALDELTKQSYIRPRSIDESLESFKRVYNESLALLPHTLPSATAARSKKKQPSLLQSPQSERDSFASQIDSMTRALTTSWDGVLGAASGLTERTGEAVQTTLEDLHGLQGNLLSRARNIFNASLASALSSSSSSSSSSTTAAFPTRQAFDRERSALEQRFRDLEREGQSWVQQRAGQLESSIKLIREGFASSTLAYEELVSKRKASMYYTALSDSCLAQVLKVIDLKTAKGWKLIRQEDGYTVYRRMMEGLGSQYACVMCSGVINAPPKDVYALFEDSTRVTEYNSFYAKGRVVEVVAENTKISWAATPPVFPFKPRDFCTLIHSRKLKDGTYVVLNKAAKHPDAPPVPGYVRGSIVLAANIIRPVPGFGRKTHLTMLTQLDPGGFAPPVAVNHVRRRDCVNVVCAPFPFSSSQLTPPSPHPPQCAMQICTLGPIGFMRAVEVSAKQRPSKRLLMEKQRMQKEESLALANAMGK